MYSGLEYSNSGTQAIRAVLTLFALAGHLDVPGGSPGCTTVLRSLGAMVRTAKVAIRAS